MSAWTRLEDQSATICPQFPGGPLPVIAPATAPGFCARDHAVEIGAAANVAPSLHRAFLASSPRPVGGFAPVAAIEILARGSCLHDHGWRVN